MRASAIFPFSTLWVAGMGPFGLSRGAVCVPSMATSWTTQGPLVSSVRTVILPSGNAFSQVMAYAVASLALVALNPPGALNLMSSECSSCSAFSSWALNAATKRAVVSLDSVIASPPKGVPRGGGPRRLLPSEAGNREDHYTAPDSVQNSCHYSRKWLRARANIPRIERPRLLSVAQAAAELNASEAYVRRMLLRQRLYGIKVGIVWAILPNDLEAFRRTRRPPGRPRKLVVSAIDQASAIRVVRERKRARTDRLLRKPRR